MNPTDPPSREQVAQAMYEDEKTSGAWAWLPWSETSQAARNLYLRRADVAAALLVSTPHPEPERLNREACDLSIERDLVFNEAVRLRGIADDLFEFAVDACCQGTGTAGPFGDDPLWHMHMSTWEWAAEHLPRIKTALGRVSTPQPEPGGELVALLDDYGYDVAKDGAPMAFLNQILDDYADDRLNTIRAGVCVTCWGKTSDIGSRRWSCAACGSIYELPESPGAAAEEAPPEPAWAVGDWLMVQQEGYESLPRCAYEVAGVWNGCVRITDCYGMSWTVPFEHIAERCDPPPAAAPPEPARPERLRVMMPARGHAAGTELPIIEWTEAGNPVVEAGPGWNNDDPLPLIGAEWVPASPPSPDPEPCRCYLDVETGKMSVSVSCVRHWPVAAPVDEPEPLDRGLAGQAGDGLDAYRSPAAAPAPSPDPERPTIDECVRLFQRIWYGPDGTVKAAIEAVLDSAAAGSPEPERPSASLKVAARRWLAQRDFFMDAEDEETRIGRLSTLRIYEDALAEAITLDLAAAGSPEPGDDGTPQLSDDELGRIAHDASERISREWASEWPAFKADWIKVAAAVRAALGEDRP